MLLLNVSDIHFNHPACNSPMDADRPFRTRLIQDARARVQELGTVGAILVSGDIAFKGQKSEYDAAYAWICELAHATGCLLERVYVIPGNHDVDRNVARTNVSVRNVHRSILAAEEADRERELRAQFSHHETGVALMEPIAEYNKFAARFGCQVYAPEKLFWHQDLPLDPDTQLRIYGLTSTLVSGANGLNDTRPGLYISPLQTVLDPIDGVINLVMCHHPPDWLMDQDGVTDAVDNRAMVQFFGHKHRTRIHRDTHYVRFSAGAVNPERNVVGWEPGYNFVNLSIKHEDDHRYLDVEAHLLVWQTNPEMFTAKQDGHGGHIYRHRMRLPNLPHVRSVAVSGPARASTSSSIDIPPGVSERETTMSDRDTRSLVLRFWDLATSQRREIALELDLLNQDEIVQMAEPERYGRALSRAGERGLLEKLAEEIQKREEQ